MKSRFVEKIVVCSIMIVALLGMTTPIQVGAAEQATIKVGIKSYTVTDQQINTIKSQPGIEFSKELPKKLPASHIAVAVPEQLGGGYLIGSKEVIAAAFNTAGVTVGLTAAAIITEAQIVAGVAVVTLAGVLVAATSDSTTTHTHRHFGFGSR